MTRYLDLNLKVIHRNWGKPQHKVPAFDLMIKSSALSNQLR